MAGSDEELKGLLDMFEDKHLGKAQGLQEAVSAEDAWLNRYEEARRKVIRPTMEFLGAQIRQRGHDFNIVETQFLRENRAIPEEATIRIDIYLSTDSPRTGIGMDRRPYLGFATHHRTQMIQVSISDMTASGGVISKIGDYPIEKVDPFLVRDKFIALFNRLLRK